MSGALAAIAATGAGAGGGSGGADVTPNALNWSSISSTYIGSNETLTIGGINATITLSVVATGAGDIYYSKNGVTTLCGATMTVANGDTLAWLAGASGGVTVSGTVTITNLSDAGAAIDSFNYDVFVPF